MRACLVLLGLAMLLLGLSSHSTPPPKHLEEPNSYLSFLPTGATPDYRHWQDVMRRGAAERRARLVQPVAKLLLTESEPNDSPGTANVVAGFGSGFGEDPAADVQGSFAAVAAPTVMTPSAEDEGSIPLATDTGLTAGNSVILSGTIGDGPFGSAGTGSGDYDFFRIPGALFGQRLTVDVDTPLPMGALDPNILLYDSAGNIVIINDDEDASVSLDSFIAVTIPADDDYYLSIGGSDFPFVSLLSDPFDSSTGIGVTSEGEYSVTLTLENGDADWFTVELEACDILGVNLSSPRGQVLVEDPSGKLMVASNSDLSFAYPEASPLPGGGSAALAHVATVAGTYRVRAVGVAGADYTLELRVFRPPLTNQVQPKTVFVDFDGATIDRSIFRLDPEMVTLSPLSAFLSGWGLSPADEDALIDAIMGSLAENIFADPRDFGPNGNFAIRLLNSRDHADPFGDPTVSRLIIGGSQSELGLATIGIAQSLDPGNFEGSETGVVLLDRLSGPITDPDSLNGFPRAPGVSILDFVALALGNIAAHEAGHYTGNFHTEQFNATANLMDRGGNLPNTLGLGPDGIFGSADDVDVDFGEDLYVPTEGFTGFENTLTVVACGCNGNALFVDGFESGNTAGWDFGVGAVDLGPVHMRRAAAVGAVEVVIGSDVP